MLKYCDMNPETPQVKSLLVVVNPEGSHADQVQGRVIDLLSREDSPWRGKFELLQTKDPRYSNNVDLIGGKLQSDQVVLSCGGDGLFNDVGNAGITKAEALVNNYLVALPYGNANDGATSLNGRRVRRASFLPRLLSKGVPKNLDAIQVDRPNSQQYPRRFALSYVGLGYTALGSEALNDSTYRQHKKASKVPNKLLDGWELIDVMRHRESLKVAHNNGVRELQELVFAVQPRMAAGLVRFDTRELDGRMVCVEIDAEHFIGEMVARVTEGQLLRGINGERIKRRLITVETATVMHYDGEDDEVKSNETIEVNVAPSATQTLVLPKRR